MYLIILKKIRNKSHLELVVKDEKVLQGIPNLKINVYFDDKTETSFCKKAENDYKIFLARGQHNVGVLRHEIYHIANEHTERELKGLLGLIKYNW